MLPTFMHLGKLGGDACACLSSSLQGYSEHTKKSRAASARAYLSHLDNLVAAGVFDPEEFADPANWEKASIDWRNSLLATDLSKGTKRLRITGANWFIAQMQRRGHMPAFRLIPNMRQGYLSSKRKPSLADGQEVEGEVDFPRKDRLARLADSLDTLRTIACTEANRIWEEYREVQALVADADLAEILDTIARRGSLHYGPESFFSRDITGLSRLVALIINEFDGLVPRGKAHDYGPGRLAKFKAVRGAIRRFGGNSPVAARMYLTAEIYTPFALLILLDTAMNASSLDTLPVDCLAPTDDSRMVQISWNKERSGRSLARTLAVDSDAVTAIQRVIEMTKALRQHAPDGVRDRLFIFFSSNNAGIDIGKTVLGINEGRLRKHLRSFLARSSSSEFARLRPDSIRISLLEKRYLESGGDVLSVKRLAQHTSLSTTEVYLKSTALQPFEVAKIRDFQARLVADAQAGVPTGTGLWCSDPKAGHQPQTRKGEACSRFDRCVECQKSLVVATPETVSQMILFLAHIDRYEADLRVTRSSRWLHVWEPYRDFLQGALAKIRREYREVYDLGSKLSKNSEGDGALPPLN